MAFFPSNQLKSKNYKTFLKESSFQLQFQIQSICKVYPNIEHFLFMSTITDYVHVSKPCSQWLKEYCISSKDELKEKLLKKIISLLSKTHNQMIRIIISKKMYRKYIVFFSIICITSALSFQKHTEAAQFCWKDSYGRGAGTIPPNCPEGQEKIGAFCYEKCPTGYSVFGFDCHQNCPEGLRDDGLFCRRSEYGRGSGYAWWWSDGWSYSGMFQRCEKDNGAGNCEYYGAMVYPKCQPGYTYFGCCICRPSPPDCIALGMNPGIDLSCAKKIIIRAPYIADCNSDQDYDAGLCYSKCAEKMTGVGPVCWGNPPANWVNCGMGAAKDSTICTNTIFDQVSSVGNMALNVATLGANVAANAVKKVAKAAQLKKQYDQLKKLAENSERIKRGLDVAMQKDTKETAGLKSTVDILNSDTESLSPEQITRSAALIAAIADPTGVADVVGSFTYAKCSQI